MATTDPTSDQTGRLHRTSILADMGYGVWVFRDFMLGLLAGVSLLGYYHRFVNPPSPYDANPVAYEILAAVALMACVACVTAMFFNRSLPTSLRWLIFFAFVVLLVIFAKQYEDGESHSVFQVWTDTYQYLRR